MSSSRRPARAAVVFGALAVLVIPAAVVAAQVLAGLRLLQTLYAAVPASFVLAFAALAASRRARFAATRSVRPESGGPVRLARLLAWAGLYAAVTGGLALAVYGALRWAQG